MLQVISIFFSSCSYEINFLFFLYELLLKDLWLFISINQVEENLASKMATFAVSSSFFKYRWKMSILNNWNEYARTLFSHEANLKSDLSECRHPSQVSFQN